MESLLGDGSYIYCIFKAEQPVHFGPRGIGERKDNVYSVHAGGLAAMVSQSPVKSYPVSRENMLAHEKIIEEVMKQYSVLPVRFCTIATNDAEVEDILRREHDRFASLLQTVEGKKELGLRGVCTERIYTDIVEKYVEIKALKEKIAMLPAARTHSLRMEIGRQVEAALKQEKESFSEDIMNTLSPLAVLSKSNKTYGEMMVLNAAFLVDKSREPDFDRAVDALSVKYGDRIKFKYIDALPPFNFVNVVIDLRRERNNVST